MPLPTPSSDSNDLRSPLVAPTAAKEAETEKLCIDEMLRKHCGEFGRWQLKHFVLTSLAWALEAFHTMIMIFADREPDWKCLGGAAGCDGGGGSVCGLRPGEWEWVGGRGGSTVSEWGLICGDKFKVGLVQALFFAGCMIGKFVSLSLISSYLSQWQKFFTGGF